MKLTLSSESVKAKMAAKHYIEPTGFWSPELYSQKDWTLIEKKAGRLTNHRAEFARLAGPCELLQTEDLFLNFLSSKTTVQL